MATKKNSSAKSPQATSRSNRDSMRWILGLLLLFAGLFLTASVLFYYFDWRADMSLVSGVEQEDPRLADLSDAIENPCGYAGAWLAERLVGRSFGLFGIICPDRHDGRSADHPPASAAFQPFGARSFVDSDSGFLTLGFASARSGPFSAAGGAVPSGSRSPGG